MEILLSGETNSITGARWRQAKSMENSKIRPCADPKPLNPSSIGCIGSENHRDYEIVESMLLWRLFNTNCVH